MKACDGLLQCGTIGQRQAIAVRVAHRQRLAIIPSVITVVRTSVYASVGSLN
jgi:hypothetical protein